MEIKNFIKARTAKTIMMAKLFACGAKAKLSETRAENFVDSGLKILIAVVLGALLLGGLYALFGQTIIPTLTNKVKELFNFKG